MASEPSSAPPSANQSGASAQEHRVSVAGCTHPNQQHPDHRPSRTPERRGWCGRGLFVRQGHADRRPPVPPARLLTSPQPSVGTRTLTDKRRVAKRTPHTPHRDQPTPHNSASAAAHPHQPGKADEPRLTTSTSNVHYRRKVGVIAVSVQATSPQHNSCADNGPSVVMAAGSRNTENGSCKAAAFTPRPRTATVTPPGRPVSGRPRTRSCSKARPMAGRPYLEASQ